MKHQLRSSVCTEGRRMAGARALWVANGMKREQFGKPIIAIVNSFTQFVPCVCSFGRINQYFADFHFTANAFFLCVNFSP